MPITLHDKTIDADVRAIGAETCEGPSALIARLLHEERTRREGAFEAEVARRKVCWDALMALLPVLSDAEKAAIDRAMDDLIDETGLPK